MGRWKAIHDFVVIIKRAEGVSRRSVWWEEGLAFGFNLVKSWVNTDSS